jgi:hypothetical protein
MFVLLQQALIWAQPSANKEILQTEVSISYSKASLYDILNRIQDQYKINFSYSDNLIPLDHTASIDVEKQPLYKVLNTIFSGTAIGYKLVGKQIVLVKTAQEDPNRSNKPNPNVVPGIKGDSAVKTFSQKDKASSIPLEDRTIKNIKEWKRNHDGLKTRNIKHIPTPDSTDASSDTLSNPRENSLTRENNLKKDFLSKKKQINKFSMNFNFTIGSSFRRLTNSNDSKEGNDLIKLRNGERSKLAFNSEIQCSYYLTSFFNISGGVGYMNMGEKGHYKDSVGYTNSYSYFTIPITASYNYHSGDFSLKLGLGLVPSFLSSKGNELQYEKLKKLPQEISDKNNNLAYSLNLEGGYKIKKITLSAGLNYIHFFYSTYTKSAPLQERNYLTGLKAGIQYNF